MLCSGDVMFGVLVMDGVSSGSRLTDCGLWPFGSKMRLCLCQCVAQELFAWEMFFRCYTSRCRFDVGACSKKSDLGRVFSPVILCLGP